MSTPRARLGDPLRINFVWLLIFALTLPIGVVLSTNLARRSFEKVSLRNQTITVKGYAEKQLTSDYAQWSGSIRSRAPSLAEASKSIEASREKLFALMSKSGFEREKIGRGTVGIQLRYVLDKEGHSTNTIETYELSQSFWIDSNEIHKIETFSRDVSNLISEGIELDANPPRFLCSTLESMKLEMIAAASANAHERAEKLLTGGGSHLGELRSASQGVFQITPPLSTDVDNGGYNDTGSINKVIKAVVTCEFAIDS
ncbi:MAG TPA: SIMPL domain-containing protein [Tepidisphaeraceae bacterium]|nr:SIMPL domain-containing protein [Tepidisphaeraceae bacterium]